MLDFLQEPPIETGVRRNEQALHEGKLVPVAGKCPRDCLLRHRFAVILAARLVEKLRFEARAI